jgi:predicted nucleotidyltransferase
MKFCLKVARKFVMLITEIEMVESKYLEGWRRRFAEQEAESRALAAQARAALPEAVAILKKYGVRRVILFGSLCREGRFHRGSDIDLAVEGLPPQKFFRAGADLMMALDWPVDLKPLEEVDDFFRQMILKQGEVIYAE